MVRSVSQEAGGRVHLGLTSVSLEVSFKIWELQNMIDCSVVDYRTLIRIYKSPLTGVWVLTFTCLLHLPVN